MYFIGLASIAVAACAIIFAVRDTLVCRRLRNDSVTGFSIGAGLLATSYALFTNRMHDTRPAVVCSLAALLLGFVALVLSRIAAANPGAAKHLDTAMRERSTSVTPDQRAEEARRLRTARVRLIAVLARGAAVGRAVGAQRPPMSPIVRSENSNELPDSGGKRTIEGRGRTLRVARGRRRRPADRA